MKTLLAGNKNLRNFLYSVLTGVILIISWPPHFAGFLLFIAFVPLIYVLDNSTKRKQVFFYSFTTTLIWAVGTMYWEAGTTTMHSNAKILFFIPSFFLVALFMTIPMILWKRLSKYFNTYIWWLSLPLLWTAYEFLTGKGDLAMTWLNLEFGLSYYPRLIRSAQYTGPQGVAFIVMSVNILLYLIWKNRKEKKTLTAPVILLCIVFLFMLLMGFTPSSGNANRNITKKIAIIQPNWKTFYAPNKNAFQDELDTLQKLAIPLIGQHPDLIVCSEGFIHHQSAETHPILVYEVDKDTTIKQLKALSQKIGAPILTGIELAKIYLSFSQPTLTAQYIRSGYFYDSYNAAVLISPDQPTQIYTKTKLCPFIERIPFLGFLSFFNNVDSNINKQFISFATIENQGILHYGDMRIATAICWENSFPDYVAEILRKNNANMVAVVSSNFSLGETAANIDAAYSIPLAIETQCPLVRCANTGISCFIDKNGVVQQSSKWSESRVLIQDIELDSSCSFFVKHGNFAGKFSFYISLFLVLYAVIRKILNRKKDNKNTR